MRPREPMIAIAGLNKWFGEHHVLRDIDLVVGRGEKVVVCGPSGSGKSTMIRCINRQVLDVMTALAEGVMTMILVTHEMGFARSVADTVCFMDQGQILESAAPGEFFAAPKSERTRDFLSQILY